MPIEIKVVSQPDFDAWVASKAPPPPAASSSAPAAPATPAAPAAAPAAAAPQHVAQNSSTAALR